MGSGAIRRRVNTAIERHLVEAIKTLFVDRYTWSPPKMRGARVWEASIAEHLHRAACLEELARRGGPRSAREYSERDWLRQGLDRDVLSANLVAWQEYRTPPVKRARPRRRAERKRLNRWELALQLHEEGAIG